MKVLITTDLYNVSTNGVVTSVRNLMEELEGKGHEVRVLTFSEDTDSYKEGNIYYIKSVSIGYIYPDIRMPISYRNWLVDELIDWKPDVIHSQCEFFSYQFAQRIARKTGAPLVHTYHTLYEDYVNYVIPGKVVGKRMVRKFSRMRLKKSAKVIAPTNKVENILHSYGMENEICVVPSGLDLKKYDYQMSGEERLAKRMALEIPEENKVLLNLGRLGTEKNVEELIELFAEAYKENDKLTFLIVGDGPAKEALEEKVRTLGVENQVIFTGMIPSNLVREYYQLADVFVSASTSETQGLTYIEAAANGLPLLCRRDDCLAEVIEEGINGYQYTSEDEFLEKLHQIVNNPEWHAKASQKSREIAEGFDKKHFGDKIENIYENVILG